MNYFFFDLEISLTGSFEREDYICGSLNERKNSHKLALTKSLLIN